MIERAPEVLDHVSNDCADAIGNGCDTINLIRAALIDDALRLGRQAGVACRPEFGQVLLGPSDFQPNQGKSFLGIQRMLCHFNDGSLWVGGPALTSVTRLPTLS